MLQPKRTKYRKKHKDVSHIRKNGRPVIATRGQKLSFGDFGLMVTEPAWLDARQLEAGRVALTREIKRGGMVWMRVFPDKPLTKKPAEVRMGKGKGAPELWVAEVQAGRIIFEMTGVSKDAAKKALALAAAKLPVVTKFIERKETLL